ncbi:NADH:flavin oxidoreductase/NADH oxidase [Bradyrhizobium sp. LHD-71]|uniref:NADH:flavin oxidoreductase/NADH oxidase n=1 Tax=Bradyrhizobium sp. LHD-71 TaxID=3072141 RepID=UPI00280D5C3C|nr:NADH:flavin oxidoreductase/NADH oxidase [Bradyrhizobium sp. LHD-71]MDQ8730832.1 NADH:flavin oxidoreductase/NADH oxidase [Bradyrhizobium sp. LHD-71]
MSVHLFDSIQLAGLPLPNRVIIAPMCQYSATPDGTATDWHTIHLGHLALSGAGLLIVEATAVEADGRISPRDLGLWSDDNERGLARVLEQVRNHATMPIGIQLAHAGRKTSHRVPWEGGSQIKVSDGGWTAHAPSAIPFQPDGEAPRALDRTGLARVKAAFRKAAERSVRLGFDAIEIHSAHGYLLHEFLSPLANKRDDEYGGSLANRMRFPLEVFDAMREVVPPHIPLGLRYSATDFFEGGWDLEQTLAYSQELKARGCSFFDVSGGGMTPQQKITLAPGYQVPFAEAVKRETNVPTMAVGLITEPEHAERIVATGQADMVALARGVLYDARWPWHAAAKLGAKLLAPKQYLRAPPHTVKELFHPAAAG